MKAKNLVICTLVSLSCLCLFTFSSAQAQQPASPEKLRHIRQLIAILGGVDGLKRSMQDEITALREKHPGLKNEYWESLTREVDEKELPAVIDRLVTTYDALLTDGEVSDMLRFYESPTGKKLTIALPQISKESSNLFTQWRQSLMKKVADMQGGLIRAAALGDTNKINELLATGADVNERNAHGVSPLMATAFKGNKDLAQLLVEKRADVNAKSNKGSTSLMAAVESNNTALVEFLLSKGADPDAKDMRGLNAYQMALLRGQRDLMPLLKDKTKDTQPVEVRAVVAYLRGQDCHPVFNEASDTSPRVECLKAGEKVELAGLPTDTGWAMIRKPTTGWVRTSALKQALVFGAPKEQRTAAKPLRSVASEAAAEAPAAPETSDEETTARVESLEKPRIWWRR